MYDHIRRETTGKLTIIDAIFAVTISGKKNLPSLHEG
jgi:hypothetical protein